MSTEASVGESDLSLTSFLLIHVKINHCANSGLIFGLIAKSLDPHLKRLSLSCLIKNRMQTGGARCEGILLSGEYFLYFLMYLLY